MQIAARIGAWAKSGGAPLPYDAEVEWLEFSGGTGQFIDADIRMSFDSFGFDGKILSLIGNENSFLFSNDNLSHRTNINLWGWPLRIDGRNMTDWITTSIGTEYVFHLGSDGYFVNGARFDRDFSTSVYSDDTDSFYIGGSPLYSSMCLNGRMFFFLISVDGIVVRDFIPVRFTNENGASEGAMYDRVSGQLFRNEGTGAFVIGSDKM